MAERKDLPSVSSRQGTLMRGALILAAAQLASRFLGAVYRIPLYRMIGDQGMGLVQMAYPVYSAALALSTAGLPVAISKVVAEALATGRRIEAKRSLSISLIILALTGLGFSSALMGAARTLSVNLTRDPRSYHAIIAVGPAVFFVALMSAFRGYFQGHQNMVPTAVSQVIEQVVRVVTMFALAYYLLPMGIEYAAAGATFGAVTGAAAGLVFLLGVYRRLGGSRGEEPPRLVPGTSTVGLATRIVSLAVPISVVSVVFPVMQVIDMAIVPRQLQQLGLSYEAATGLYGQLSGGAAPLVNVPIVFTGALAASLVPAISESNALKLRGDVLARTSSALRLTLAVTTPATAGLFVLAAPITQLLYGEPGMGPVLAATSATVVFLGLQQTTSAILQGLGLAIQPLWNVMAGAAAKAFFTWSLTMRWGIIGAALSTALGFAVAALLNLVSIRRIVGPLKGSAGLVLKPAAATAVMAGVVVRAYPFTLAMLSKALPGSVGLAQAAATLGSVAFGMAVYALVLFFAGGLDMRDIQSIPGIGRRIARFMPGPNKRG